jgi:hypothetical protein
MKPKPATAARLIALLLAVPVYAPAASNRTAANPGSATVATLVLNDASVDTAIAFISDWAGCHELNRNPDVDNAHHITFNLSGPKSKAEAVELLRAALKEQANVSAEISPDGVLRVARLPKGGGSLPPLDMSKTQVRNINYANVPPELIFRRLKAWSGKEIHVDATTLAEIKTVTLYLKTVVPTDQIFWEARKILEERSGIVLDEQPDGSYRARLTAKSAPAAPSGRSSSTAPSKQP